MRLAPLMEDNAAQLILRLVPPQQKSEVARALRLIQIHNWLAGYQHAAEEESAGSKALAVVKEYVKNNIPKSASEREHDSLRGVPPE